MKKRTTYMQPDEFPEWHNNSLRLTVAEIKEPSKVISDFFDFYDIQQFRYDFKEMLHASFHSTGGRDADFVHLYDLIEKLVEANWIIFQNRNHIKLNKNIHASSVQNNNANIKNLNGQLKHRRHPKQK